MIHRKLDNNGDMTFGHGAGNFYRDQPEAVAQAVMTTLKLFQGEWFLNILAGIPYNTKIVGFSNARQYDMEIKQAIRGAQGVDSIVSYFSYVINRNLNISATINTIYGQTTITAVL